MKAQTRDDFERRVLEWARQYWLDVDEDWAWHRDYYVAEWTRAHADRTNTY